MMVAAIRTFDEGFNDAILCTNYVAVVFLFIENVTNYVAIVFLFIENVTK